MKNNSTILSSFNSLRFFLPIIVMIVGITGCANNGPDQTGKIVFRYDDFKLKSSTFYDSLLFIFKKNQFPICLGLTPFDDNGLFINNLDSEQIDFLEKNIRENNIELALHGYNHKDNGLQKRSFLKGQTESEFAMLSFNDQYTKLKLAKEKIDSLFDINLNIFIPPFNTFDENTLKALDSFKFNIISASIRGPSNSDKIMYIPSTVSDLKELPKIIKKYQDNKITIVMLMHPDSFVGGSKYTGSNIEPIYFKQLDTLLHWIRNQGYIYPITFSELNKSEIFDNKRFQLNSLSNNLLLKILNKIGVYRNGVYFDSEYVTRYRSFFTLLNIAFHITIFLIIFYLTKKFTRILKPSKTIIIIIFSFMSVIFLLITYNKSHSSSLPAICILMITIFVSLLSGSTNCRLPRSRSD